MSPFPVPALHKKVAVIFQTTTPIMNYAYALSHHHFLCKRISVVCADIDEIHSALII